MALSYLEQRALAAYYRSAAQQAAQQGGSVNQPGDIHEVEHDSLKYVQLSNVNGVLAVYRVRIVNGKPVLKGLKRWPAALDGGANGTTGAARQTVADRMLALARGEATVDQVAAATRALEKQTRALRAGLTSGKPKKA